MDAKECHAFVKSRVTLLHGINNKEDRDFIILNIQLDIRAMIDMIEENIDYEDLKSLVGKLHNRLVKAKKSSYFLMDFEKIEAKMASLSS